MKLAMMTTEGRVVRVRVDKTGTKGFAEFLLAGVPGQVTCTVEQVRDLEKVPHGADIECYFELRPVPIKDSFGEARIAFQPLSLFSFKPIGALPKADQK